MARTCVQVARGLVLYGEQIRSGALDRKAFMTRIGAKDEAFRKSKRLGATIATPGLRFYLAEREKLSFGPGAGLVLGMSVGPSRIRATLVDANGDMHHKFASGAIPGLRLREPKELLDHLRAAAARTLTPALKDESLLVDGTLPLLGVTVAWCTPLNREKRPVGNALAHPDWHDGSSVVDRTAACLQVDQNWVHAINDTQATAIAVAFDQTRAVDHVDRHNPRLAIALRTAGGIGGAVIIVEPPQDDPEFGKTSGFAKSILLGGRDHYAGEIGHMPIAQSVIDERNGNRPPGLAELRPIRCSCTASGEPPNHVEALTAIPAVASRIDPTRPEWDVVEEVIADPTKPTHQRALEDVGAVLGHALLGPVAMLNPATITLTGTLAVPPVKRAFLATLADGKTFGDDPEVYDNAELGKFAPARGAGLTIIRARVYRRFQEILGGNKDEPADQVRALTLPMTSLPWEP